VTGSLIWCPVTLPALPASFAGFQFHVQSITLEAASPLIGSTTRASNGVLCTVGNTGSLHHLDTMVVQEDLTGTLDGPGTVRRWVTATHVGNATEQITNLTIQRLLGTLAGGGAMAGGLIHDAGLTGCRTYHTTGRIQDIVAPGPDFPSGSTASYRMNLIVGGCMGTGGSITGSTISATCPANLSHQAGNTAVITAPVTIPPATSVSWTVTGTGIEVSETNGGLTLRAVAGGNPGAMTVTCTSITPAGKVVVSCTFYSVP
jgi:hypothetical protein